MNDYQEIISLREENDYLKAELARWKEKIGVPADKLKQLFNLTPVESAVLSKLLDGRITSVEWLTDNLSPGGETVETDTTIVRMCHIRKKIAPHCIVTCRGVGYKIADESLNNLRVLVGYEAH